MNKLQKARLDLFNLLQGKIIPNSIMTDIKYGVDGVFFDEFKKIYDDPRHKYLLIANDATAIGYEAFWYELFAAENVDESVLDFLMSRGFSEVKACWKDELTNFIRNEASFIKRPYLKQLADDLYYNCSKNDLHQTMERMLVKQANIAASHDVYYVYWAFCLLALRFDLVTEDLLQDYYLALRNHEVLLKTIGRS